MDIKAVITDARVTMYTVNTFAITLALIGCFQEPQKSSGRRSRSSESDANMKTIVETARVKEVIEDLESCSNWVVSISFPLLTAKRVHVAIYH